MKSGMLKSILILTVIFSVSGCGEKRVYVQQPLELPPTLVLPSLIFSEFECAAGNSKKRLVQGIELMKNRIVTLENIIRTTHE